MSLVREDLPNNSVDTLVCAGHEATTEQLRAVCQCPILGYCYTTENNWTVYVAGGMSPELRTAVQEGHTDQEVLLVLELPAGIQEITLPDHRRKFTLQKAA